MEKIAKRILALSGFLLLLLMGGSCRSLSSEDDILSRRINEYHESFKENCESESEKGIDEQAATGPFGTSEEEEEALSWDEIPIAGGEVFSFELRGATLANAVNMIADMADINLLLDGDFSDRIEASFNQVDLSKAFSSLCYVHKCNVQKEEGVYVVSRSSTTESQTELFQLASIPAKDIAEDLASLVGEDGTVVVNESSNIVVVTAPRSVVKKVRKFVNSVDTSERQVLIETQILEFSLTDLYEFGTQINLNNIHVDDATATLVSGLLTTTHDVDFTIAGDKANIDGAINTLSKLTKLNIISRPTVMAKNEHEAKIEIIEEIPYVESTVTTTGDVGAGVGSSTVEQVEFKDVGITLVVTPTIIKSGVVSLTIDQDVSEHVDTYKEIPVINHRHIITTLQAENGQTIIIGGLIKENVFEEEKGIPVLKDIPLLGALFRGVTKIKDKIELVVMITPRIVDSQAVANFSSQYRAKLKRNEKGEAHEEKGEE